MLFFFFFFFHLHWGLGWLHVPFSLQVIKAWPTSSYPAMQINETFVDIWNTRPVTFFGPSPFWILCGFEQVCLSQDNWPEVQRHFPSESQNTSPLPLAFLNPVGHMTVTFVPNRGSRGSFPLTKADPGGRLIGSWHGTGWQKSVSLPVHSPLARHNRVVNLALTSWNPFTQVMLTTEYTVPFLLIEALALKGMPFLVLQFLAVNEKRDGTKIL